MNFGPFELSHAHPLLDHKTSMDWENRTEVILPAGCGLGALIGFGVPWPVRPTGNGVFTGIRWGIVSRFCTETKSVVEICPAGPVASN